MHYGLHLTPDELPTDPTRDVLRSTLSSMRRVGLKAKALHRVGWETLSRLGSAYPCLGIRRSGGWIIITQAFASHDGTRFVGVMDPVTEAEGVKLVPWAELEPDWSGVTILCKRVYSLFDESQPFGFRWFLPEIFRNAKLFRGVALAAIMSNLIGLGIPLLFQVMVDKVITHHSQQTLLVVVLVYLALISFDGMFSYVRQQLMLIASNKIDARLSSRTFQHLLGLPLSFFETSAAGILARNMQQTEKLRHFLTGRLFQVMLDAVALPVLIILLAFYSGLLTMVVLGFSLAIAAVIGGMVPIFREALNRLYESEAGRQAHLIETLYSMRAVKSLVLEGARQKIWDHRIAQSLRRYYNVGRISALGNVATTGLEKLMQISILAIGAYEVFSGNLSLGALIAFNMLSGRATGPLVQIVALINEYQEAALSVRMLGTVMNAPQERSADAVRPARPTITGAMTFDNVSFRYNALANPALSRINFTIAEGEVIGVVGRSGSGKTTITRLIQAIHAPQEGLIQLNGVDVRHIDLSHLRRSIGVVLQENLLFRGTIRENIAAARPEASLVEVLEAARMAGADEFIERLPLSYDTFVEENASNFSGGQRQRIAIARALLTRPRFLVFDEATSALDPESEAIIQTNLSEIARGRTMLIVSHRLSSLVRSDRIMVLERGELVDFAPHSVLLERCEIYRHLWQTQTQHIQ
jgi:ATP-binding cassette, subfamily B, bacterial HlyB/CyaB